MTQSPWSANAAAVLPAAGTALSPRTYKEIHLTVLPSEVPSLERARASVAAQFSEIRERSGPVRDGQAADPSWIQLGVFPSDDAAAHLAERFRSARGQAGIIAEARD